MTELLIPNELPQNIALIMDGNRRWARQHGLPQLEGHRRGLQRTREVIDECLELGIQSCTLWCFSTENWKRDQEEVDYLMMLFEEYLKKHVKKLHQRGVRIRHIGRKDRLPTKVMKLFAEAESLSKNNTQLTLQLAIDYGGQDEILRAVNMACQQGKKDWNADEFSLLLDTAGTADPDLIIRTSGELRMSGYLLWQSAYSEFYFTETCFPEFTVEEFHKALKDYSRRQRTRGGNSTS